MASCSIWPVAASATSRCCAIRGERHRSRRVAPDAIDEEAAEDDPDAGRRGLRVQRARPGARGGRCRAWPALSHRFRGRRAGRARGSPDDRGRGRRRALGRGSDDPRARRRPDGPGWPARRGDRVRIATSPIRTAHSRTSWARSPPRSTRGPSRARRFAARSRQTGGPRPAAPDKRQGRGERHDQLGAVAPHVVDEALDRVDLELDVLVRDEQAEELAVIPWRRVEPAIPGVRIDDHRHPVVQRRPAPRWAWS